MDPLVEKALRRSKANAAQATMDSTAGDEMDWTEKASRNLAAAIVQQFVETDDLDEGETLIDRLYGTLAAVVDRDEDGELNEDEEALYAAAIDAAWDYMAELGVAEEDLVKLFDEEDEEAAERVRSLLIEALPEGEAAYDSATSFAEGVEPTLDAVPRGRALNKMIGKTKINSKYGRMKKTRRLRKWKRANVKQRMALKKASTRAHTGAARVMRSRSAARTRKQGGVKWK